MKSVLVLIGKAALAATVTVVVIDHLGSRLPDKLVIGGKDIRPYVAGTAALAVLMWAGQKNKLGPVGDVVKPAA